MSITMNAGWTRLLLLSTIAAMGACAAPSENDSNATNETANQSNPIIGGVSANKYPEAALIDMYVNGQLMYACSGTVIAPRVALTAGHCIQGITSWAVRTPYAGNQSAKSTKGLVYDYNVNQDTVDPSKHDVGLIILDTPINLSSYPTIAASGLADGAQIVNIGRIQNGTLSNTDLFVSPAITVTNGASQGYPLDYVATDKIEHGDSGGPDMAAGTHTIVAVNSGAGGGTEVLARVDLIASWIADQIKANGGPGTGGGTTPGGGGTTPPGGGGTPGAGQEAEPNDTYDRANALSGSMTGALTAGDQDWFTWSIDGSLPYDVKVTATGDAQIRMWKNVNGQYYNVANTSATDINHTASGAGTYVLAVYSASGAAQSYTVTLTK